MPDAISALDLVSWTLAISSDEAKNARLKEIEAQLATLTDMKTRADASAKQAAADLAAARELKAEFDSRQYGLKVRADEMDAREKTLAELNTAISDEKKRFQSVRDDIEAQHRDEDGRLKQWDALLTQREADIVSREKAAVEQTAAAEALHAEAKAKIMALVEALAVVAPPEPIGVEALSPEALADIEAAKKAEKKAGSAADAA